MSGRPHTPVRPLWLCRVCIDPWPCEASQRELLADYAGHLRALRLHLARLMIEADRQLTTLHPYTAPPFAALYARFLGWLPHQAQAAPGSTDETAGAE